MTHRQELSGAGIEFDACTRVIERARGIAL
jgi:hypothetical protein